jgi:hypothetical protein
MNMVTGRARMSRACRVAAGLAAVAVLFGNIFGVSGS